MNIKNIAVILVVVLAISGLLYNENRLENTIRIGVLSETASLPIIDAYDKGRFKTLDRPVEVVIYLNENAMLYDAKIGYLDGFLCEPSTFIVSRKSLSDFVVVSSTYKELYLISSKKNNTVSKLNDVQAAAMGIYNYNQCEYFLDLTIQAQNVIGLSMDEVVINDPLKRVSFIEDNTLDFGVFTSPYSDYLLTQNTKLIQKMSGLRSSFVVLAINKNIETGDIEIVEQMISEINDTANEKSLKHYNYLIDKYFNLPSQITLSEMPFDTTFKLPNFDDMDSLLSWLYNTERIPTKFKYFDLVTELIAVKSH